MRKWVFGVLTRLVTSQRLFHVGGNVAMANTHDAGSRLQPECMVHSHTVQHSPRQRIDPT